MDDELPPPPMLDAELEDEVAMPMAPVGGRSRGLSYAEGDPDRVSR